MSNPTSVPDFTFWPIRSDVRSCAYIIVHFIKLTTHAVIELYQTIYILTQLVLLLSALDSRSIWESLRAPNHDFPKQGATLAKGQLYTEDCNHRGWCEVGGGTTNNELSNRSNDAKRVVKTKFECSHPKVYFARWNCLPRAYPTQRYGHPKTYLAQRQDM